MPEESQILALERPDATLQPKLPGQDTVMDDIFPALNIADEDTRKELVHWFTNDLRRCIDFVEKHRGSWERWQRLYDLEDAIDLYSDIGGRASFPSGLITEKVIEAMDRLMRAVYTPDPLFVIDEMGSDIHDIGRIHRMEHWMDNRLRRGLQIEKALGKEAFVEFLLDGSLIVEVDNELRIEPRKTVRPFENLADFEAIAHLVTDQTLLDDYRSRLAEGLPIRAVVEEENAEKEGLSFFIVDKIDHLIPPDIYRDADIRFRARRLYYTESDLRIMASDAVNWYKKADVDKVLGFRQVGLSAIQTGNEPPRYDEMRSDAGVSMGYDWDMASSQWGEKKTLPYKDVYIVFRIFAKFGYPTQRDPKGLIPKWAVFDFEPDSQVILRARTYPHFDERLPWIHFRLGHSKKSYYGYGFGALLEKEDSRKTSILNLYLDSAANAAFPPYLTLSPEFGGTIPFRMGMGPGQMGFVQSIAHFKQLDLRGPPDALLGRLLPICSTMAENRTGITSYTMGQTESTDPRSPARKTELLLGQAEISFQSLVKDWNIGWEALALHAWKSFYEIAIIRGPDALPNLIDGEVGDIEGTAQISMADLLADVAWLSQASASVVNPQARKAEFLQKFSFYMPLILRLWRVSPEIGLEYFVRWMQHSTKELELRGAKYLIPTREELRGMPADATEAIMQEMQGWFKGGGAEGMPGRPPEIGETETEEMERKPEEGESPI